MVVREEKAIQIMEFMDGKRDFVVFKTEDTGDAVLLMHGDEDANVQRTNGWHGSPAIFLKALFDRKPELARDVIWLGCFCGRLDPTSIDGIHVVRSAGEYYGPINVYTAKLDDGTYRVGISDFCPMDIEAEWIEYRRNNGPVPTIAL